MQGINFQIFDLNIWQLRTTDNRRPKKPVIVEKSNVFGALTPKEIVNNNPLIGLFASITCRVIRIKI